MRRCESDHEAQVIHQAKSVDIKHVFQVGLQYEPGTRRMEVVMYKCRLHNKGATNQLYLKTSHIQQGKVMTLKPFWQFKNNLLQVVISKRCWVEENRAVLDFSVRNHFTLREGPELQHTISMQIKKRQRRGRKSKLSLTFSVPRHNVCLLNSSFQRYMGGTTCLACSYFPFQLE